VYRVLYLGAFGTLFSLEATLTLAAPLMLTALCTAIPARAGLLVIGGEGALVIGGLAAVFAGVSAGGIPPILERFSCCLPARSPAVPGSHLPERCASGAE
jgi:simple sugar transport system permease protein